MELSYAGENAYYLHYNILKGSAILYISQKNYVHADKGRDFFINEFFYNCSILFNNGFLKKNPNINFKRTLCIVCVTKLSLGNSFLYLLQI